MLFSLIKLEIVLLSILLLVDVLTIKTEFWKKYKFEKKDLAPLVVITILSIIFSIPMITSGYFGNSLRLVGVNNIDGIWYLAQITELKNNFPPQHPGFAGYPLTGYHFLYFFLLAKISNIFGIPSVTLLFSFGSVLTAVMWGLGVYCLILKWSKDRINALIAVFLTMFGGSFVFISWLQGHRALDLDSGYGILQPPLSLLNPPFAISVVFLTAFLISSYEYFKSNNKSWIFPLVLIAGAVSLFKVYAGIIILGGFLFIVLVNLLQKKFYIIYGLIGVILLFFATYWPFTDKTAHLIFYPLWAPHSVLKDNMPWYGYTEKFYTYSREHVIKGLITIESYALFIFLIGNIGSRIIGLVVLPFIYFKKRKLPSLFSSMVFLMLLGSILTTLFFIQTGKVFETIQFSWYFLFLISLFSSFGLAFILELKYPKFLKYVFIILFLIITLPSAVSSILKYTSPTGGFIDPAFYSASIYLKNHGSYNQTVLTVPNGVGSTSAALNKWYISTNPIVPAIMNKRSFLSFEYFYFNGLNTNERLNLIKLIINTESSGSKDKSSIEDIKKALKKYDIVYIYSMKPLKFAQKTDNIKAVYNRSGQYIYEVN
ncbi:MAG TPA: hypothetical protein VG917_04185 [Patescibacteria group bacterium]|nr:hypothetical protein [Patescibacteria group bacterium]